MRKCVVGLLTYLCVSSIELLKVLRNSLHFSPYCLTLDTQIIMLKFVAKALLSKGTIFWVLNEIIYVEDKCSSY